MKENKAKSYSPKNPISAVKAKKPHRTDELAKKVDELLSQKASLEEELAENQKKMAENEDFVLRLKADFDNYRKRVLEEKERLSSNAGEAIFKQFLNIYDSYSKALDVEVGDDTTRAFLEGFKMIKQEMDKFLQENKVMVSTQVGDSFDPNIHQAIFFEETDSAQNQERVMEIFQNGYLMNGRMIREAVVKVEKPKASEVAPTNADDKNSKENDEGMENTSIEDR